jgi:hyaluronan synthase
VDAAPSGPTAAYRAEVVRKHLGGYLRETFWGRGVELSDDSLLTLYAALEGRTADADRGQPDH